MLPIATTFHHDNSSRFLPFVPIRAVVLDDNHFDQRRIERMARDSGLTITIDIAATLDALSDFIRRKTYDVAFLDYRLPAGSGRDAIDIMKADKNNQTCANIMVAGEVGLDTQATEMRNACDGFISKDQLNPDLLRNAVIASLNDRAFVQTDGVEDAVSIAAASSPRIEAEVENLIREVRHLRATNKKTPIDMARRLSDLERSMIRIWTDIRGQKARETGQSNPFDILLSPGEPPQHHH